MNALIKVIDDWEDATDNNQTIHAVFFDFQKAFDISEDRSQQAVDATVIPQFFKPLP